jgi:hypothetical protein
MDEACTRLTYRAVETVAASATVQVALPDGRVHARLDRRATDDGRPRWDWRGGGLSMFSIEFRPRSSSFLLTDSLGVPFGRIGPQGTLQPRLTALDAEAERFVIDLDGRIRASRGLPRGLGRITVHGEAEVAAGLEVTGDETLATLLAAAPLCHAVAPVPARRPT